MHMNITKGFNLTKRISSVVALYFGLTMSVSAQVEVDINFDLKHIVGDQDAFDREKYIVIHADATESDYNNQLESLNTLLNTYDAHYGRETGRMRFVGDSVTEDPVRPGFADPASITSLGTFVNDLYASTPGKFPTQFKGRTIAAAQHHPFFPDGTLTASGFSYSDANDPDVDDDFGSATGEFMALFLRDAYGEGGTSGAPRPTWVEVINEPFFPLIDFAAPGEEATVDEIFELHRSVAREIKEVDSDALVGGFTNAFPDLVFRSPESTELFSQWDERWRRFIDEVGDDMDFYSIHLYDFHSIGGGNTSNTGTVGGGVTASSRELLRKGGNIEATLDMIEHYNTIRWGSVKPWVISEYGGQLNDFYSEPWSPSRDWLLLKSFSSMMMQFMERPNVIEKTVPFALGRADFLFGAVTPGFAYPWRMLRGPNEPDSLDRDKLEEAVFTELIKFYELWSEVNGTRVDTRSTDLDLMVDAYVNTAENKAYVILNSLDKADLNVNLNELGIGKQSITNVKIKHLFQSADGSPQLSTDEPASAPGSVVIKPEATMIIEYTFDVAPPIDETSTEEKIYAATYKQVIRANQAIEFTVPGVTLGGHGEAVLRLGVGRHSFLERIPSVTVNGNAISMPLDYRGDTQLGRDIFPLGENLFFGMLEAPVPYDFLTSGDNIVEVTFPDGVGENSGAVSSLALQTFSFTRPVVRTAAAPAELDDRVRFVTFDNRDSFITSGETLPRFELGDKEDFAISYATGVANGVEEDLTYVATQVRQLDETGNTVATSAFNLAVPGAADNAGTTKFSYTIPTNFATGADGVTAFTDVIPESANLPAGHKLMLILFMSTDNNSFFANANTEIMIGDGIPPVESRDRSITFNNISNLVPAGATLPEVGIGQVLNINVTYQTGVTNFVEEDLNYVAVLVRQLDENRNTVADSAFTVVVPGTSDNAETTTFSYAIPSNFATGADGSAFTGAIPETADLPQGHQLQFILFMATNNFMFFANANTDITVGEPTDNGSGDNRVRSLVFDNINDFVPAGGSLPHLEIGQELNIDVTYATGISGGVEEDLAYIATQVRQLDENGGIVATSAFNVAIPGTAANSETTSFSYTIPKNFATGPDGVTEFTGEIPETADLPQGHQLQLILFMSTNNNTFFVNANTKIIIEQKMVTIPDAEEELCFPIKAKNGAIAVVCL